MIQSGPTTPKTPRSLSKRALVFTREDSPLKMTFVAIDKEGKSNQRNLWKVQGIFKRGSERKLVEADQRSADISSQ